MRMVKGLIVGTLLGLLVGWSLFGLQILPTTIWHWSFSGESLEMNGQIAAPILIRMPSGSYFYIYEYEDHGDVWYLHDYVEYYDGHWGPRIIEWPLTLGMSNSYEIIMMPTEGRIRNESRIDIAN